MPDYEPTLIFEIFNEIGIIEQLTRASLEARLPDGLIAPHFTVLNHLTRVKDGQTPLTMARAFQVPKTSMTHTLKGLLARDLVEIRANPNDGRSKQVWLTQAGKDLRAQTITDLAGDSMDLIKAFDLNRLAAIKPVLTELRVFLDERRNKTDGVD
ncbi:MarR family transcriptional regulator [Ascidiaceihabitans sp.]|uniref:MarR family winged helix-turn-helix transcriptional regulator n=1 Tax=Ascidiaceihabitans sp. TaxID=1872644 RepID=UPI0032993EE1